jgi:hypothetical protein
LAAYGRQGEHFFGDFLGLRGQIDRSFEIDYIPVTFV